ncbi:imidazole glycerol phosphate synthase subunit HisH [Mordavella massiliensis]|uniref:Imidazole glycerol phosphate synthase subunit HisH n=1 Tax=Mordavella massiliensis TaxID=1871024 RepID=A0A938XB89_9CLOT|nr:imidazole glycerol phosphate synthase subunit HisH [Mordavella massiliensis]MBM6948855.1 imidazole glycerol phosphate synthase subunit HisH [Mordavella massiliensis]
MIAIIDSGMGNVGSIANMLKKIGAEAVITNKKEELHEAEKIILPGVGTFDHGMECLREAGLPDIIRSETLENKKPLLGICLGMQLLGKRSDEGKSEGLNLIDFETKAFNIPKEMPLKIPHMGWDVVEFTQKDKILEGITGQQRYYFVHSYHAVCTNKENILMKCDYGYEFAAAVKNGNVYGTQFHPEKSHRFGMRLLENFVRRV